MRFLADMGVSQSTVLWIKEQGFDAVHVRDEGMKDASDAKILEKARKEERIILTYDLDFGDLMSASKETYPSVIILRLENETPLNVNKRLKQVLEESSEALVRGAILSVEETRHRVRLLPL